MRLSCADLRVRKVSVTSSRAGLPPRLVRGRRAGRCAAARALLFSICQRAQGAASASAIAAAQGQVAARARSANARRSAWRIEMLQEGVWRLLIDWPKAMGDAAAGTRRRFACARRAAAVVDDGVTLDALLAVADDVLREHVYGASPEALAGIDGRRSRSTAGSKAARRCPRACCGGCETKRLVSAEAKWR